MLKVFQIVSVISVIVLAGCSSHENPIKTQPKKRIMNFLYKAEVFAHSRLNMPLSSADTVYINCMNNRSYLWGSFSCNDYFQAMIQYAHTKTKKFQYLTYGQLTNKVYFKKHIEMPYINFKPQRN